GTLLGLSRDTTREQVILATLEGVALQVCDMLDSVRAAAGAGGTALTLLRADGGMANNRRFLQRQAQLAGVRVERRAFRESTVLGAACAAAVGAGVFALSEVGSWHEAEHEVFSPDVSPVALTEAAEQRRGW